MNPIVIFICLIAYVGLLFLIASWADKRALAGRSLVNHPLIYALSLSVYCTAWTFYGSVGRASATGIGFLPIYLGPTILAPLWGILLLKIVEISKHQRITSVADFISSRYGKSTSLGVIASLIAVVGVIPYISIQLKAMTVSFEILMEGSPLMSPSGSGSVWSDIALYITIALAIFTILFGTRHLDPNERHEGLVAAIAFESVVKLVIFLAVGLFVVFFLFDGFGDLFQQAMQEERIARLMDFQEAGINGWSWFWLSLLSMSAVLFLPRQFHVGVVENISPRHVKQASWLFPLYLLLINIFVLPIAFGGMMLLQEGMIDPDTYVLALPLSVGNHLLATLAAIGGFSAGTGMVIVAVIALSIMVSNNLVLPLLLRTSTMKDKQITNLSGRLLGIRRIAIVLVLLLSYSYFRLVGQGYTLVSIGLISFTAVFQFAPVILGGIYWKRGTRKGAIAGLIAGFSIWAFTLPFPNLAETGLIPMRFVEEGLWGIGLLRPYALFGLEGLDHVSHAAFWSILFNSGFYVGVSLYSRQSALEIAQADLFVNIRKYRGKGTDFEMIRRRAEVEDVVLLLNRFLGEERAAQLLQQFSDAHQVRISQLSEAGPDLINFAENHLSGAIGAASAKVIIRNITKEQPISLEEMLHVLDQTQEILEYSKALEIKSKELEQTTDQLKTANEQLRRLDELKADFITTVTHELRTPITSIKALSQILRKERQQLPQEQQQEFLDIIVNESSRVARLVNQVLDIEKLTAEKVDWKEELIDMVDVARQAGGTMQPVMEEQGIRFHSSLPDQSVRVKGDRDKFVQVLINLLSNAVKFCDSENGEVAMEVSLTPEEVRISVRDNGIGIAAKDQKIIFDQFTQLSDRSLGKPGGSGLGLFISRRIVEHFGGQIGVRSKRGRGATFFVAFPRPNS
jgi:Na+/proline symporter/nitrogen-specific signal transduction histidine kinase